MCLTCDFTVSGEISKARAMRLLERPRLINARISYSRAVSASLTRQLDSAKRPYSERTSHSDNRLSECICIFLLRARSASAIQLVCGLRNLATPMAVSHKREGLSAKTISRRIKRLLEGFDPGWRLLLFCGSAILRLCAPADRSDNCRIWQEIHWTSNGTSGQGSAE